MTAPACIPTAPTGLAEIDLPTAPPVAPTRESSVADGRHVLAPARRRPRRRGERVRVTATLALVVIAVCFVAVSVVSRPHSTEIVHVVRVTPGETLDDLVGELDPTGNVELQAWQLSQSLGSSTIVAGEVLRIVTRGSGAWSATRQASRTESTSLPSLPGRANAS